MLLIHRSFFRLQPKNIYLSDDLSQEQQDFIRRIAREHGMPVDDNRHINQDLIQHFETILKNYRDECKIREAFVMGALTRYTPVGLLFNHPDLREPQLCNEIFEFAGMKKRDVEKQRRAAFVFGSRSNDAPISLLFKEPRHDQTKLCREIFEFADLKLAIR